jgi:hypothetical protein
LKIRENEGRNEEGSKGLRMSRTEEVVLEEEDDFGVLHNERRYKRQNIGAEKGESCIAPEGI